MSEDSDWCQIAFLSLHQCLMNMFAAANLGIKFAILVALLNTFFKHSNIKRCLKSTSHFVG